MSSKTRLFVARLLFLLAGACIGNAIYLYFQT